MIDRPISSHEARLAARGIQRYKHYDPISVLIRTMSDTETHHWLCHPEGEPCPDGCDTMADNERLELYNKAFDESAEYLKH